MNAFQIVVLPVLGILFVASAVSGLRARTPRRLALVWSGLWLVAGVCVARPGLPQAVARAVGIKRGADLVFYCAILVMLVGFYMAYVRLRRLEANITRMVRHLAIEGATTPRAAPGDEASLGRDDP